MYLLFQHTNKNMQCNQYFPACCCYPTIIWGWVLWNIHARHEQGYSNFMVFLRNVESWCTSAFLCSVTIHIDRIHSLVHHLIIFIVWLQKKLIVRYEEEHVKQQRKYPYTSIVLLTSHVTCYPFFHSISICAHIKFPIN